MEANNNFDKRFPELRSFLAGAFHQESRAVLDWQGRTPNVRDAVRFYKLLDEPEIIAQVTRELRKLLALQLSENDLHAIVESFRVYHNPTYSGGTFRGWLEMVLEILEDPNANTSYLRFKGVQMRPDWNRHAKK
jgi:hypothetical protein